MTAEDTKRLSDVVLDETIGRATPDVEHERAVAIFDLIEENSFEPVGHTRGPQVNCPDKPSCSPSPRRHRRRHHILSLTPFRRI